MSIRYKRVSFALVFALSLLLLVIAATPVQGGTATLISVYIHCDAECSGCVFPVLGTHNTHKPGGNHFVDYDDTHIEWSTGDSLHRQTSAMANCPWPGHGGTKARSNANQHVTMTKAWGNLKADSDAQDGDWATARALALADPVAAGGTYTIDLKDGIKLHARGGSVIEARVNITLWDEDGAPGEKLIWNGRAKYVPGSFDESDTWPEGWDVDHGRREANYPKGQIDKAVPSGHRIKCFIEVYARADKSGYAAGGGGKGKAMAKINMKSVGGIAFPVDKLALLAPYIALAVAVVAVTLGAAYGRKRWLVPKL